MDVLDNPVWHALTGPQATVAEGGEHARRFDPAYAPFGALPDDPTAQDWDALRTLVGGGAVFLPRLTLEVPDDWAVVFAIDGTQMVHDAAAVKPPDIDVVRLSTADEPEAADLVARTQPGPWASRTIELGTYLGVRVGGALVAMAGERMHPPGYTEISAVCTDPVFRGRGLAAALVLHLVAEITARDELPCLHAISDNTNAIHLYEQLGFTARPVRFLAVNPK